MSAWQWTDHGISAVAEHAAAFGHPLESQSFTDFHLAVFQCSQPWGYDDLKNMGFIRSSLPLEIVIYFDRNLDLKSHLSIPSGTSVREVKQMLADSDPTGQVSPSSIMLKPPDSCERLADTVVITEHLSELDLCQLDAETVSAPEDQKIVDMPMSQKKQADMFEWAQLEEKAPAAEPPRLPSFKKVNESSISDAQWDKECQAAFELAFPPLWEFQERIPGRPPGAWHSLPEAARDEINAVSRRGQRRGTITLGGSQAIVDLDNMVAIPQEARAVPKGLRKKAGQVQVSKAALKQFYFRYAVKVPPEDHHKGPDGIAGEEFIRLFEDIEVDPGSDVAALAFAAACNACEMGVFRRDEFIRGCAILGTDSLEDLLGAMHKLREDVLVGRTLPEVYAYTFGVALEPPSKVLPLEDAQQYWALLLHDWPLREDFCSWAENNMKRKAVNRDLWMLILKLAKEVPPDLSTYDDNPAWPVVIDDFVEYYREQITN